jgi:hypothetical protein
MANLSPLGGADSPGSSSGDGGEGGGRSGLKRKAGLDDTDGDALSPRKQAGSATTNNNDVTLVLIDGDVGSDPDIDVLSDVVSH